MAIASGQFKRSLSVIKDEIKKFSQRYPNYYVLFYMAMKGARAEDLAIVDRHRTIHYSKNRVQEITHAVLVPGETILEHANAFSENYKKENLFQFSFCRIEPLLDWLASD
ncbi:MAG: hypothetical protein V1728_04445 [Candidatus Micrarchaeota archaeon]